MNNHYEEILSSNIDKLVNLYNQDIYNPNLGNGDRLFWGWKVIDFSNATLQGGIHSLAAIVKLNIYSNNSFLLDIIDSAILAIPKIRNKKNAVGEAYPNENSFCVTALVAFDTLQAIDILEDILSESKRNNYLGIIEPLIKFLHENNEEHAIISNHIATAVAAITKWKKLTRKESARDNELLEIIYHHQNEEGWYLEYEGPDPGYQTLCTYYLACAYQDNRSDKLLKSLNHSATFLSNFVAGNGLIGGIIGSRNTEVYYPGGIEILANYSDIFKVLKVKLTEGIKNKIHLLPQNIDIGNYIPLINSYACAALNFSNADITASDYPFEKNFPNAGLYILNKERYTIWINYKKGGVFRLFDKKYQRIDCENTGWFGRKGNKVISNQIFQKNAKFIGNSVSSEFYLVDQSNPNSLTTIIIRLLGITVFQSLFLGNLFKKVIVKKLMTRKTKVGGALSRTFDFKEDKVIVSEKLEKINGYSFSNTSNSRAIHMASSGYTLPFRKEIPLKPEIVDFINL